MIFWCDQVPMKSHRSPHLCRAQATTLILVPSCILLLTGIKIERISEAQEKGEPTNYQQIGNAFASSNQQTFATNENKEVKIKGKEKKYKWKRKRLITGCHSANKVGLEYQEDSIDLLQNWRTTRGYENGCNSLHFTVYEISFPVSCPILIPT